MACLYFFIKKSLSFLRKEGVKGVVDKLKNLISPSSVEEGVGDGVVSLITPFPPRIKNGINSSGNPEKIIRRDAIYRVSIFLIRHTPLFISPP